MDSDQSRSIPYGCAASCATYSTAMPLSSATAAILSATAVASSAPGPGHWLDAGPMGCLGVGTGFAIATRIAKPDKQVLLLLATAPLA